MRLITFFLLITNFIYGQQFAAIGTKAIPINFEKTITIEKPSNDALDSILILMKNYSSINNDTTLLLAKRMLVLTKSNSKKHFYINTLIYAADANQLKGNAKRSLELSKEANELVELVNDEELKGSVYLFSGKIAEKSGNYENALANYLKAAKVYERSKNQFKQAQSYHNISGVFFNLNELNKSEVYQNQVKILAEKLNNDELRIENLALSALLLMTKATHFYNENEDELSIEILMDTLNYYFNKSAVTFDKALEIAKRTDSRKMEIVLSNNLVALLLNMEDYDKATILAKKVEILATNFGDNDLLIQSKVNLSSVYRLTGKLGKATKYGEEALALATKSDLERKVFLSNRVLYELYKKTGQFKKAMFTQEALRTYDKKIGNTARNKALAEVEAKFQNEKKQKEILELQKTNEKVKRQRNLIIASFLIMVVFGFSWFQFNKVKKERNDKMAFAKALIFAQEEERKRIARDLHDGIGQSLLLMKKQLISTHTVTVANQQLITDTLEEVRSISKDLHPFQLEKFGLTTAIEDTIAKVEKSTDLFVTMEIENIDANFTSKTDIHVFRAIQEALNNIVKHANATAAKVIIENKTKETLITILDNGQGFDHELAIAKSRSLGLKTMHERLASIGGKMKITKNEPSGTRVEFRILK
jgi:signal transduction histidine kinase